LNNPTQLDEIISAGQTRARKVAKATLNEVRENLGWERKE
jgi:hypothetical protein